MEVTNIWLVIFISAIEKLIEENKNRAFENKATKLHSLGFVKKKKG